VTATTRRSRALVLVSAAALALSTVTAASAQEELPVDSTGVTCDAEPFDDEGEEFAFYLVEPGETVACTAFGLDPESDAEWAVDVYGATEDEFEFGSDPEDLDDEEPYVSFGSDGPQAPTEDGELTFDFTLPEELVVGGFDGVVWQGDAEDPTYEELFGGLIFGFFLGDMTCDPDPAVRGEGVDCVAELEPGDFDWEVYELSASDLIDLFLGVPGDDDLDDEEFDLEPSASGAGTADDEGSASFSFTPAVEGEADVFFAIASQDDGVAFYAGEIVAAAAETPAPTPTPTPAPVDTEDDDPAAPVAVPRPTRVEAGAGGAADGGVPTGGVALVLGLALTAAVTVRRSTTQGR
jgi:hypothetical protein